MKSQFQLPNCRAEESAWSSSYLANALVDVSLVGNRPAMTQCYQSDIQAFRILHNQYPKHTPVHQQTGYSSGGGVVLRVLTWNINFLSGPDSVSLRPIDPDSVADVIAQAGADVLCLQETLATIPPSYADFFKKYDMSDLPERMARFEARLLAHGYSTSLRSSALSGAMPTMIATSLPHVIQNETLDLATHQSEANGMEVPRSAAYLELAIAPATSVGVYCTHLNHQNHSLGQGQRHAEATTLLSHASARKADSNRLFTLIAADFNQSRQQDYATSEWDVISKGLGTVKQPLDDGVAGLLSAAGWRCCYDLHPEVTNYGNRSSPAFTHWTGTTVDYVYLLDESSASPSSQVKVLGSYVIFSDLSDHLPVITDFFVTLPSKES